MLDDIELAEKMEKNKMSKPSGRKSTPKSSKEFEEIMESLEISEELYRDEKD